MTFKRVVTVILLVFVAASLGVLLYRNIGGEGSGGRTSPEAGRIPGEAARADDAAGDNGTRYVAYYFHGNNRCKTCLTIELYTLEALEKGFPDALSEGRLEFRPVNLENGENEHFIDDFQLSARTVVLERITGGRRGEYVNLNRVWELVGDKEAFTGYIQDETEKFMNGES